MTPYSYSVPGTLIVTMIRSGNPAGQSFLPTTRATRQLTCSGIVKGNFKSPNGWSFRKDTRNMSSLEAVYGNTVAGNWDFYSGPYIGPTENQATWVTEDMDAARSIAYAKLVDNIRGGTDVSVDAFQMRQTIGTPAQIALILKNMRKIGKQLRRGDIIRPMKQAGNAWLLWVYGVKPTMQTIHDLVTFARKKYLDEVSVFEGHATITRDKAINIPGWPGDGWSSTQKVKTSCRARYKLRMKIPDNELTSAARLSSLNPASIAWELMPWSFVVDWIYNIGDYLRGLETSLVYGRYFTDGFVTETYVGTGDQTATRDPSSDPAIVQSGSYQADGRTAMLNRIVLSSFPSVPVPKIRPELSSGRLLNAAALLTTFLGRKSN